MDMMNRRSLFAGLIAGIASALVGKAAEAGQTVSNTATIHTSDGVEWQWRGGDAWDDVVGLDDGQIRRISSPVSDEPLVKIGWSAQRPVEVLLVKRRLPRVYGIRS